MAAPRSSHHGLEIIRDTAIAKLFFEIEQEILTLEKEAEEAKKQAWYLEFQILELHRMFDKAIESIAESYLHKELPLKTRPGVWSVIYNN